MKSLLSAIQTRLRAQLTYIRDGDIYITPHENYIPHHVRPPCVGIKDGDIDRSELVGECVASRMTVSLIVFVQLPKDEASIMGDSSTGQKGVLDAADDIVTALDGELLDVSGLQAAFCDSSKASELFGDERETLQRKIIRCQYEKEE